MTTFISYSRRQLYFAEALALHLQARKIDVWFDLQQLQAGTDWAEGLTTGVQVADRLVLVVSRASLESEWTQAEWKKILEEGKPVVLAVCEPVDMPDILHGLPTFDLQTNFSRRVEDLAAYLKGESEARRDAVSKPNRLGLSTRLPFPVLATLAALLVPIVVPLFAVVVGGDEKDWEVTLLWVFLAISVVIGGRFAIPFWRHVIGYRRLRRGVLLSFWMQVVVFPSSCLLLLPDPSGFAPVVPLAGLLVITVPTLLVFLLVLRRSAALLHWLRPNDDLQALRRRIHQPLVASANQSWEVGSEDRSAGHELRCAIHADPADAPFARRIDSIVKSAGHHVVSSDDAPDYHLALISNRSSQLWIRELTQDYPDNLVCIIGSTIEMSEGMADAGKLQWVDWRKGDRRDIVTLLDTLADPETGKRAAALEATPAMIDHWKVPAGITMLKRLLQFYGVIFLISIPFMVEETERGFQHFIQVSGTIAFALGLYWLLNKAIIQRKLAFLLVYPTIALIALAMFTVPEHLVHILPLLKKKFVVVPVLCLLLLSLRAGSYWFPTFAPAHQDQVGIKESIWKSVRRQNIVVACVIVAIFIWAALR